VSTASFAISSNVRACRSCVSVAEGAELRGRREKRRHYSIARGSAMECVAALDVVRVRGLAVSVEVEAARRLNIRVIQMLTKLDRALA
jgi:four helix bundle protein